jgi:hypothetical protein
VDRSILAAGAGVLVAMLSLDASAQTCRWFFPWQCTRVESSTEAQPGRQPVDQPGTARAVSGRQTVKRERPSSRQRKQHLASRPASHRAARDEQVANADSADAAKTPADLDARQRDLLFEEFLAWRKRLSD